MIRRNAVASYQLRRRVKLISRVEYDLGCARQCLASSVCHLGEFNVPYLGCASTMDKRRDDLDLSLKRCANQVALYRCRVKFFAPSGHAVDTSYGYSKSAKARPTPDSKLPVCETKSDLTLSGRQHARRRLQLQRDQVAREACRHSPGSDQERLYDLLCKPSLTFLLGPQTMSVFDTPASGHELPLRGRFENVRFWQKRR